MTPPAASHAADPSAAEVALLRTEWQRVVFADEPRRLALLQLRAPWPLSPVTIAVLRNHTVETGLTSLRSFLAYAGYAPSVVLSEYDDWLSRPPVKDADVHLVWLDLSRYAAGTPAGVSGWLSERIALLRTELTGPILVIDADPSVPGCDHFNESLREAIVGLPDVHVFPLSALTPPVGHRSVDDRASSTGTHVSGRMSVLVCQHLGLRWIPALLQPRLKAIVVDLDNTLIGGVLAEDGVDNVLTGGQYAQVRARLLALHAEGLLLALVSKNDARDIERLLDERAELRPLRQALVAIEAGWQEKVTSVKRIVDRLHIGTDSLLVVDDNPGEIAAMASALHDTRFVWASEPEETVRALRLHPGLHSMRRDDPAAYRMSDILAAQRRSVAVSAASDPAAYIASLQVQIQLRVDESADRARLSELSRKTNQFNTTLVRFSEVDVDRYLKQPDRHVVSMRLRDRLSDSGLVGAIFARRDGDAVVIDEIAISCRALGRSLEPALLAVALAGVADRLECREILISIVHGPRNDPARAWAEEFAEPLNGDGVYVQAAGALGSREATLPLEITWEAADA